MRKDRENQLPLTPLWPHHQPSYELQMISRILDENPEILDLVLQDLSDQTDPHKGSPGLSAEQVLRCAVVKNWQQLPYQKLAFHLDDSISLRAFCRLPLGWTPCKSCLQENISRIRASTWEKIHRVLIRWAAREGLEKGEKIRVDATAADHRGLRKAKKCGPKKLAKKVAEIMEANLKLGRPLFGKEEKPPLPTLKQYYERFKTTYMETTLKPSTFKSYEMSFRVHILPALGNDWIKLTGRRWRGS